MTKHRQARYVAGLTAVFLTLSACHGNSPGNSGYVPSSLPQSGALRAAPQSSSPIGATCKTPIQVGLKKDKTCHFSEAGYKGTFTIDNHLGDVAAERPHQGTKDTAFLTRGMRPGSGYFTVQDSLGNALRVDVTVPAADIVSTCGRKVNLKIAGIETCQFHEFGYAGQFTIEDHLAGIATVSPGQGDKHTPFTVLGVLTGGGYFIVHGARNLRVRVEVTL